jgi:hypothetical protein
MSSTNEKISYAELFSRLMSTCSKDICNLPNSEYHKFLDVLCAIYFPETGKVSERFMLAVHIGKSATLELVFVAFSKQNDASTLQFWTMNKDEKLEHIPPLM